MKKWQMLVLVNCFFGSMLGLGDGDVHQRTTSTPFAARVHVAHEKDRSKKIASGVCARLPKAPTEVTVHGKDGLIAVIQDVKPDRFFVPGLAAHIIADRYTQQAASLVQSQIQPLETRYISKAWLMQACKDMQDAAKSSAETVAACHTICSDEDVSLSDFDALLVSCSSEADSKRSSYSSDLSLSDK